jgi:hypothetical protein
VLKETLATHGVFVFMAFFTAFVHAVLGHFLRL